VPPLYWGDVDLLGKEVEIIVKYESPTGRIVQAQTKHERVPGRKF